jgi:hypothetical protein
MDRIAEVMRDTGLDFPTVVQLLAIGAGIPLVSEPAPMPLPPDEAERRLWIEAWMAGADASWQDRAVAVRLSLKMLPREARDMVIAALRIVSLVDLVGAPGPTLFESDASADYDRWRANTTPPTRKPSAS